MERIQDAIPTDLRERIRRSSTSDLLVVCSTLIEHLHTTMLFHQLLEDLVDPDYSSCAKDFNSASTWKKDGNAAFGKGDFQQALQCYSQALRYAPLQSEEDRVSTSVLFVNRATTMHKLRLIEAVERDCTRAIWLNPSNSKAWYRRSRTRAELKNYAEAITDMRKALALETSAHGRRQVATELEKILADCQISPENEVDFHERLSSTVDNSEIAFGMEKVWAPEKGWGLHSRENLKRGSLVLFEHPYAAVILKEFRNTACHFCFEDLPADLVPCNGCNIAVYCSEVCKDSAISTAILSSSGNCTETQWPEHRHECGGPSWPTVLPTEVVLAARIVVRSISEQHYPNDLYNMWTEEVSCHHYDQLSTTDKLDLVVLATVVAYCLESCLKDVDQTFKVTGNIVAKLVLLVAKVRVTAMAIVHTSSPDPSDSSGILCHIEQVGDRFWTERQKWLESRYFFTCRCSACSSILFSDLALYGLRCKNTSCFGVVLRQEQLSSEGFQKLLKTLPPSHCPITVEEKGIERTSAFSGKTQVESLTLDVLGKLEAVDLVDRQRGEQIDAGKCLRCGCILDIGTVSTVADENTLRIEDALASLLTNNGKVRMEDILCILHNLRATLHPYNKHLAKAEDIAAEIFCSLGQFQAAVPHCQASIQILKSIYNKFHIAVAYEQLKLSSVALAACDWQCAKLNCAEASSIFAVHHGPNYAQKFPFVERLCKLLLE
eukprot:c22866_g1_i2 orf=144-2300(+)